MAYLEEKLDRVISGNESELRRDQLSDFAGSSNSRNAGATLQHAASDDETAIMPSPISPGLKYGPIII